MLLFANGSGPNDHVLQANETWFIIMIQQSGFGFATPVRTEQHIANSGSGSGSIQSPPPVRQGRRLSRSRVATAFSHDDDDHQASPSSSLFPASHDEDSTLDLERAAASADFWDEVPSANANMFHLLLSPMAAAAAVPSSMDLNFGLNSPPPLPRQRRFTFSLEQDDTADTEPQHGGGGDAHGIRIATRMPAGRHRATSLFSSAVIMYALQHQLTGWRAN